MFTGWYFVRLAGLVTPVRLRRASLTLVLLLSGALSVHAQSAAAVEAANKAVLHEPEFQQSLKLLGIATDMPWPSQSSAYGQSTPLGLFLGQSLAAAAQKVGLISQAAGLWNQLETRLENETAQCNFCDAKQEELSAFIRFRIDPKGGEPVDDAIASRDALVDQLVVDAPILHNRWKDKKVAADEASSFVMNYCARGHWSQPACKMDTIHLEAEHEKTWSTCFEKNDWVQNASRRKAYEACMLATDLVAKACAPLRNQMSFASGCPSLSVWYWDVYPLLHYTDRWYADIKKVDATNAHIAKANADPNHLEIAGEVAAGEPMHVALLEPVAVPATREVATMVPVQLENPVLGLMSRVGGTGNNGIWVPAGTRMQLAVRLTAAPNNNGDVLELTLPGADKPIDYLFDGSPAAGAVVFPAHSSLSFGATRIDATQTMSSTEFQARLAARKTYDDSSSTAGSSPFITRPILAGSEIQATLQQPIVVRDVHSDRDFPAKLMMNMMLPGFSHRDDAIQLPRGTDVYLKVVDQPTEPAGFHYVFLSVDYLMWKGKKVPVRSTTQRAVYQVPPRSVHVPGLENRVLWSSGSNQSFSVVNQVEVPTGKPGATELASPAALPQDATQATIPPGLVDHSPDTQAPVVIHRRVAAPPQTTPSQTTPLQIAAPRAPTAPTSPSQPTPAGIYTGHFRCGFEKFDLRLTVTEAGPGALTATFDYSPLFPPDQQRFIFDLAGNADASHRFQLTPVRWETGHPPQDQMFAMKGTWDPESRQLQGKFSNVFCGSFHLTSSGPAVNTQPLNGTQP